MGSSRAEGSSDLNQKVYCAILAFTASSIVIASASARTGWLLDDAFIYQRIVRNALDGAGLVFTPGEAAEGFSSPLWALLLVGLGRVGAEGFVAGRLLGLACAVGSVVALALARVPSPRRGLHTVAVLLFAVQPSLAWWAVSGLETPLFVLVATLATVAVFRGAERAASVFGGLAAITRPEGALVTVAVFVWWLLRRMMADQERGIALRKGAAFVASLALPWVAWEAFRLYRYNAWLANSALAKLAYDAILSSPTPPHRGADYLREATTIFPGELCFAALAMLGGRRADRTQAAYAAIVVGGFAAFVLRVRGDWMPELRFLLPVVPVVLLAGVHFAPAPCGATLSARALRWVTVAGASSSLVLGGHRAWKEVTDQSPPFPLATKPNPAWPWDVLPRAPLADSGAHAYAREALRYTVPGDSIVHLDVGQSSYLLLDLRVMDQFGLVSRPEMERIRDLLSADAYREHFEVRNPAVVFLLVQRGTSTPVAKVMAPLTPTLSRYAEVSRYRWWGPHDLAVLVRPDAVSRTPDPARLEALRARSPGLAWAPASLLRANGVEAADRRLR